MPKIIQPEGWAPPKGYANGVVAKGTYLQIAGQVGWDKDGRIVSDKMSEQFAQALDNVIAVVKAAGGDTSSIVSMVVYVTDVEAYRQSTREIGQAWKARMGKYFPAMALIGVKELLEEGAVVEIVANAVLEG